MLYTEYNSMILKHLRNVNKANGTPTCRKIDELSGWIYDLEKQRERGLSYTFSFPKR